MDHKFVVLVPLLGILDSLAEFDNKIGKVSPDIIRTSVETFAPKLAECARTIVYKAKGLLGDQLDQHQEWA